MSVFTSSSVVKMQIEAFRGAQGPAGPQGIQGIQGPAGSDGRDGVSPTITLTREDDGVLITTTDAGGTHSQMIYDGQDGQGGGSAAAGEDGGYYMPAVSAAGDLTWTGSKAGMPAVPGVNIKGPAGADGADGQDGVSPAAVVTAITGGHRVTITDANGTQSFDVMDGTDGSGGTENASDVFELIATIDIAEDIPVGGNSVIIEVDAVTEMLFIWEDMANGSSSNSTVQIRFTEYNNLLSGVANTSKTGGTLNGYSVIRVHEGVGAEAHIASGAISKTNYMLVANAMTHAYNLWPVTGKVNQFEIINPPTQYAAVAGTIKVFVR